jgi:hypothetical protein
VFKLFEDVKTNCEDVFAASQRVSIVYGCVWTFIKCFGDGENQPASYPTCLSDLINRLTTENAGASDDDVKPRTRAPVSAITVERKYCDIMKYVLSRTLKRVVARCLAMLIPPSAQRTLQSKTPTIPLTVHNCTDPDEISVVANDGFVYPIADVTDVTDWYILFEMKYTFLDKGRKRKLDLPISVVNKSRSITVKFDACSSPIRDRCPEILKEEIVKFIRK